MSMLLDFLDEAFDRKSWHGPNLWGSIRGVRAQEAAWRPGPRRHNIWELVLHIAAWDSAGLKRLDGKKAKLKGKQNFPPMPQPTEKAWREAVAAVKHTHDTLVETVATLSDKRLHDRVPGKPYDFYHLLHGIAQHELYHAGQIAILKKAVR